MGLARDPSMFATHPWSGSRVCFWSALGRRLTLASGKNSGCLSFCAMHTVAACVFEVGWMTRVSGEFSRGLRLAGAVEEGAFRSAALDRFIQSTWLPFFPGRVRTERGRTLLEEPATPARRTVAARGATAPAKQMEDISLAFSTLVDDATSNGEVVVAKVSFFRVSQSATDEPTVPVRKTAPKCKITDSSVMPTETLVAKYSYSALGLPDPRAPVEPPSRPSSAPPLEGAPEKTPRADHAVAELPASSGSTVTAAAACCAQCAQPGAAALNAIASAAT